ncbi:hypothetical protein MJT46_011097 [Ovis ammon polii x Ovis aries]|nr:hypothetical protein MJT46_011097 [Ovis ammon polii x Ovis aries]
MLLLCKEAQIADQSSQLPASSTHQTLSGDFLDRSPDLSIEIHFYRRENSWEIRYLIRYLIIGIGSNYPLEPMGTYYTYQQQDTYYKGPVGADSLSIQLWARGRAFVSCSCLTLPLHNWCQIGAKEKPGGEIQPCSKLAAMGVK